MRLAASDIDNEVARKYVSLDFEGSENEAFYARVWRVYAGADFSLQPPGDTATRRGFYDSWMHGCIPVLTIHSAVQYVSLFNGLLFRDMAEFNRSAVVVDPKVLMGHGAQLLKYLATMGKVEIAARRRRMRELAPAMQWRLGRDVSNAEPLDALQLALMSARQLGGPYGASTSALSHIESKALRIPKVSRRGPSAPGEVPPLPLPPPSPLPNPGWKKGL